MTSIYDFKARQINGKQVSLSKFKGKVLLIVNTASQCGFTPQFAGLEALHEKYASQGLAVLGFPSNQFGNQDPGTNEEIGAFCVENYGVSFPMMEKIDVNGPDRHPIYKVLTAIADPDGNAGDVKWNFEKFVVSADGTKVTRFRSPTTPDDPAVIAAIENALPK